MPYTDKSSAGKVFNPSDGAGDDHLARRFVDDNCRRCDEFRFCEKRFSGVDRGRIWRYGGDGVPVCLDFVGVRDGELF